jgi:antitoxin PrlF
MSETVVVSGRGQITIPAEMRKRLGVQPGGIMTIEETAGGLLLRPSVQMTVEFEIYSDEDIARWDEEDRFEEGELERLLKRFSLQGENGQQ